MKIKPLTLTDVKEIAHNLASQTLNWDEPIPAFSSRYPNRLESCIATPFMTYDKRLLYKGLVGKAAILFYLMIKNHPFENGNKRIAMTSLLTLLFLNKKWLKVDNTTFYNFARWVAESPAELKDATIQAITKFVNIYIVPLDK